MMFEKDKHRWIRHIKRKRQEEDALSGEPGNDTVYARSPNEGGEKEIFWWSAGRRRQLSETPCNT
jgi:hypothetical protein